jgi:hypothetical protein
MLLPAFIYVLLAADSWRCRICHTTVLCVAFVAPILAYCSLSYTLTGHFWLSRSGVTTMYGRMAATADCTTLKLPADELSLCPTPPQKALGPDGLEHNPDSPVRQHYERLPSVDASRLLIDFNRQVLLQQPLSVLSGTMRDAMKLFALTQGTDSGDTPITRWQFQSSYPTFNGAVVLTRDHFLVLGPLLDPHGDIVFKPISAALGGKAVIVRPLAAILRFYQLHGGYTPGPLLALAALAGLAGTLGIARSGSRPRQAEHDRALASLLIFATAAGLLLTADLFEFSWRYQLPALITLPPAGALGSTAVVATIVRCRRLQPETAHPAKKDGAPLGRAGTPPGAE